MAKIRSYFAYILFLVPILGLSSCSQDKQIVDDAWMAPQIKVIRNGERGSDEVVINSKVISINDHIRFSFDNLTTSNDVTAINFESTCTKSSGEIIQESRVLPVKTEYKILDILPLELIPSVEKPPYFAKQPILCSFQFTLSNSTGSTRRRNLNAFEIEFSFDKPEFKVLSNLNYSLTEMLPLDEFSENQISQIRLVSDVGFNGAIALSCLDFSYSLNLHLSRDKQMNLKFILDSLNESGKEVSRSFFDHPTQICRLFSREISSSNTIYSNQFVIKHSTYQSQAQMTSHLTSDIPDKITLLRTEAVRFSVLNQRNVSTTYRILKNLGGIVVHHIGDYKSTVGNSQNVVVDISSTSAQAWESSDYIYFTIPPKTLVQISGYALFNQRCLSTAEMMGFDFTPLSPEKYFLSRSVRPISPGFENDFVEVEKVIPNWSNAYTTSGKNRGKYFLPFEMKNKNEIQDRQYGGYFYWSCW